MKKSTSLNVAPFINTITSITLAFVLFLLPASALAKHVDAEISIDSVSPIFVSVANMSGSTNVNERLLTMNTPAEVTVKGHAQCKKGSAAQSVQLHFGLNYIESGPNGHTLWGIWDSSVPYIPGTISAPYSITHNINISPTWELGTLVTIAPNAVKVVEDNLKAFVSNGGSAIDFLRADASFETVVVASATVACERDGSVFYDTVSKPTTMHILYKGDPNLEVQTVGQNPNQVNPSQPGLPPQALTVNLPKAGLTPASRFYFVDRFFEGVGTFFAIGNTAKAKRYLNLSEERLAEAYALALRGDERAQIAIARYEDQFAKSKERAERKGINAVNVKTLRQDGDPIPDIDITIDQATRNSGQNTDGNGGLDLLARITDASTKHLTVLDEVLGRVPEQAKTSIEAAKERSIHGQIESLRAIAERDPEVAALIFERATEARVAYYIKFGDIKGEARAESSDTESNTPIPNDFLRGYEEYAEFGKELSEMAQGIKVGNTAVNSLVERIVYRDRKILELVMINASQEAKESIQGALDKTTPKPMERDTRNQSSEQRDIPSTPQRSIPEISTERAPTVTPPRVEQGDHTSTQIDPIRIDPVPTAPRDEGSDDTSTQIDPIRIDPVPTAPRDDVSR